MLTKKLIVITLFLFVIACTMGCIQNYGKKLLFNGGELYYTPNVTLSEASKLGQYLVTEEFFDGNPKTVQLNKTGNTYEFRMVVKKGLENDQDVLLGVKILSAALSENVFQGNQVDIHLCDEYLDTIRVVVNI